MPDDQLLLFKQEGQHIHDYTNVYDPDIDGADPSASGKIVPAVRSIVIDNRTSDWRVLIVESVNEETFKCTYRDFPYKVIDRRTMIYNYGNDVFMLYYDDRSKPTRLVVDSKMILFGSSIVKYRLRKPDSSGNMVSISAASRQKADGTTMVTDLISVAEITDKYVDGVRRCSECYTSATLVNGDIVTLELIDSNGSVVAEVELVARRSTILNSFNSVVNSVIGFGATANQTIGDNWYLYPGQSVDELSIFPEIRFSDGTSCITPVDNSSCFIYGMESVDSNKVGARYDIMIKYFICNRYDIRSDVENVSIIGGNRRVLYSTHTIEIISRPASDISKLSVIPVWMNGYYDLRFFGYSNNRNNVEDYTAAIMGVAAGLPTIKSDSLVSGSFVANRFDEEQNFRVSFRLQPLDPNSVRYSQDFSIVLKNPESAPLTGVGREYWYITEPSTDPEIVYGIDGAELCRPVIYFDGTTGRHYISSTEFESKTSFIEAFYTLAVPPKLNGSATATAPTHFRVKTEYGILLTNAIPVDNYSSEFVLLNSAGENIESGTVIVEFLSNVSGSTSIIYGVPVTVLKDGRTTT